MQRKHINTFLTYELHVEPPLHLFELVVLLDEIVSLHL